MYNHIQAPPDVMADEARTVLKAFGEAGLRVAFSIYFGNQNRLAYDDEQLLSTLPADLADQVRGRIQRLEMPDEDYLDLIAELHRSYDRGAGWTCPGARESMNVQWCSEQLLTRSREYATHLGMLIHMHLVETVYQKLYGLRKFGVTPLRYSTTWAFPRPRRLPCPCCLGDRRGYPAAPGNWDCGMPQPKLQPPVWQRHCSGLRC